MTLPPRARRRITVRLLPFVFLLYVIAYLDRQNLASAHTEPMALFLRALLWSVLTLKLLLLLLRYGPQRSGKLTPPTFPT
jgi:hypothetical protein